MSAKSSPPTLVMLFCREMRNSSSVMLALLSRRFTWEQQPQDALAGYVTTARGASVNYCVRPGSCEPSAATPETFSRHMCQTRSCLAPLERKAYVRKSSHRWRVVDVRVNPTVNSGCVFL